MDSQQQRNRSHLARALLFAGALVVLTAGILLLQRFGQQAGPARPGLTARELTTAAAAQSPAADTSYDEQGAHALTELAIELLKENEAVKTGRSALVSPLSVAEALAMTANGAQGSTRQQMETILGLDVASLNEYLNAQRAGLPGLDEQDGDPSVRISNSIWLRYMPGLTVETPFLQTAETWYGASIFSAPFDTTTARDINEWVRYETDGMLDQLLDEREALPDEAMVYLVNALAFEGAWETPYDDALVSTAPFTCEDGTQHDVELMYSFEGTYFEADLASGRVAVDDQQPLAVDDANRITGFLKRYQGGSFAFVALLPPEGISIADFVERLSGTTLASILDAPRSNPVDAYLPSFSYDYRTDLAEQLKSIGMTEAFDPTRANFEGISTTVPLYISNVIHQAHIDVDREGTSAAAATVVEMRAGASGPTQQGEVKTVRLDRPFIYLIVDTRTSTPLFLGTYLGDA